jgi:hypothetical protein
MDIYIDRVIELGRLLPLGAPDLSLPLGTHPFYVVTPGQAQAEALALRAAVYCGVTDVLQFVAAPWADAPDATAAVDAAPDLRWVQLHDLLHAPLDALPQVAFDTERLRTEPLGRDAARARGLTWRTGPDGQVAISPDPEASPRLLAGVRCESQQLTLSVTTRTGRAPQGLQVSLDELTPDARTEALRLMSERHAALSELDALHALHPTLRLISRARHGHRERADAQTVQQAMARHRERADTELRSLLDALRQAG